MGVFTNFSIQTEDLLPIFHKSDVMLSDVSEYEGGEFSLNLSAEFRAEKIKLQKGQVLMFPAYMPHQVEPVISGVRKTLVVWICGKQFV